MKKQILILLLAAGTATTVHAQYKTGIQASFGAFHVTNGNKLTLAQAGLSIIQTFNNRWAADISYQNWFLHKQGEVMLMPHPGEWTPRVPGTVYYRYNYSTVEATARYNVCNSDHNLLYAGIGPSFVWGIEQKEPPFSDKFDGSSENSLREDARTYHIGGVAQLGYDRKLFQHRISIGMSGRFRLLSGDIGYYYDLSINLGYHFNLVQRRVVRY
jgi:hypothetical protein